MGKIKFIQGYPTEALRLFDQTLGMQHGVYVRAYPVTVALLLGQNAKALDYAHKVDGGDQYANLLEEYNNINYKVNPAVLQAIKRGRYNDAESLCSDRQHDLFIKTLLVYAPATESYREQTDPIINKMEPGILKDLLGKMLM